MIWPEFKSFSFDKQLQMLYENGVFIMGIRYYGYKVNLYLIGDYREDPSARCLPLEDQILCRSDQVAGSEIIHNLSKTKNPGLHQGLLKLSKVLLKQ